MHCPFMSIGGIRGEETPRLAEAGKYWSLHETKVLIGALHGVDILHAERNRRPD